MLIVLVSLLSSSTAGATTILRTMKENGQRVVEYDLNRDKRVDRQEAFVGDRLVSVAKDEALRGKLNNVTKYYDSRDPKIPLVVRVLDSNYDGVFERRDTTYGDGDDFLRVETELDRDFDGKYDRRWVSRRPRRETVANDTCGIQSISPAAEVLANTAQTGVDQSDGFTLMGTGHRVHRSCFERWGRETFSATLREAFSSGLQCLDRLANNRATTNRAAGYALELRHLWQDDAVALTCGYTDYNWGAVSAFASTSPGEVLTNSPVRHPYIVINPNDPTPRPPTREKLIELQSTLFHEQLHNLGILHGESIEASYGCATCCITSAYTESPPEDREIACRVCLGDYEGPLDRAYVTDMIRWGSLSYSSLLRRVPRDLVIQYLQANPGERWGISALAEALSSQPDNPVGAALAVLVSERMRTPALSAEESGMLERARSYQGFLPEWEQVRTTSQSAAEAIYEYFVAQNPQRAVQILNANRERIRAEMNATPGEGGARYVQDSTRDSLRLIAQTIWLNGPTGDLENYNMFTYFFPIPPR